MDVREAACRTLEAGSARPHLGNARGFEPARKFCHDADVARRCDHHTHFGRRRFGAGGPWRTPCRGRIALAARSERQDRSIGRARRGICSCGRAQFCRACARVQPQFGFARGHRLAADEIKCGRRRHPKQGLVARSVKG